MGRAAVRSAIQSAIQGAAITYVGTVFPAPPTIIQEPDYTQTMNGQAIQESADGSACVVVVHITDDDRTRYALVGRSTVADFNIHKIALELFFASTSGDGIAAQQDYDAVVDALQIYIRSNPTMSAPSAVWSAGEYRAGVKHQQSAAYTSEDGLQVLINGVIRFDAWEQDIGAAGQV